MRLFFLLILLTALIAAQKTKRPWTVCGTRTLECMRKKCCGALMGRGPCYSLCKKRTMKWNPKLCSHFPWPSSANGDEAAEAEEFVNITLDEELLPRGAPRKELVARDTDPRGATCEVCGERYRTCVKLAFVFGLPYLEEICRKRQRQWAPDVCGKCADAETYPGFELREAPIRRGRTEAEGDGEEIDWFHDEPGLVNCEKWEG